MEVFTFNHEFVTGLKQNYNLEEGIFFAWTLRNHV